MWSVDRQKFNKFLNELVSLPIYTPIIIEDNNGKCYFNQDFLLSWKGNVVDFGFVMNHYLNSKSIYFISSTLTSLFKLLSEIDLEFLYETPYNHTMDLTIFKDGDEIYRMDYYNRSLSLGMEKLIFSNDDIYNVLVLLLGYKNLCNDSFNSFDSLKFFILTSYLCTCYYENVDYNKDLVDNSNLQEFNFENWYTYIKFYINEKLNLF